MSYFTLEQKIKLGRSLITKKSPAYVQFYITARCNMACEQCNIIFSNADAEEMNIDQIRQTAENLAKIGVCIVLLIGGEPFVRKDIHLIVKAFTDVGIHVRMQTNGIATKKALEACVKNGAHDISISLDSLEASTQETINGGFKKSWHKAIETAAFINEIFPENGSAFFGAVLMPSNLFHIRDVVELATEIGWGVSLVPAHVSQQKDPLGFRTFDDKEYCGFSKELFPDLKLALDELKDIKRQGFNLYDSEKYLDDIYLFVTKNQVTWRERNYGVCDSPNLYFAIEPSGQMAPCCDYKLDGSYPTYGKDFPEKYFSGEIHQAVGQYTSQCSGCLYGSYPEITISARWYKAMFERMLSFNVALPELKKFSSDEMIKIAQDIYLRNEKTRRPLTTALVPDAPETNPQVENNL
jgi:MoaA/NifB/PqqE/SkfB family radical SAM enzyme